MIRNGIKLAFVAISILNTIPANAATDFSVLGANVSLSGFATAGFAISDKPYNYERVISNHGTFSRDSLFGLQTDIKFTDEFSATVQSKFAPLDTKDSTWDGILNWAFLSWRPYNDLLFRVGKQRVPIYLYSETMDVGVTYDFARLPSEMYGTAPSTDYFGASFSKNWNIDWVELTLDGYAGRSYSSWRNYQRDDIQIPNASNPGVNYMPMKIDAVGTAVTLQYDEDKYRASVQYISTDISDNKSFPMSESLMPASYFVPATIAPVFTGSAYTVLPQNYRTTLTGFAFTLGVEYHLPDDFRLMGEYSRRQINGAVTGINTNGGYVALLKEFDGWTPYVSFAMLKSDSDALDMYQTLNSSAGIKVSPAIKILAIQNVAKMTNASQRVIADSIAAFEQHTIAIGTSYKITPTQKIKLEWARTHIGINSNFVDAPSGSNVNNEDIDIFSFSYNIVF